MQPHTYNADPGSTPQNHDSASKLLPVAQSSRFGFASKMGSGGAAGSSGSAF
jgi:hypothetical protein